MILSKSYLNTVIVFGILLFESLYMSELGGPGSIYNILIFLSVLSLLGINREYERNLFLYFSIVILSLSTSVLINYQIITAGSISSLLFSSSGLLLFSIKDVEFDIKKLRKFIKIYLFGSILISLYYSFFVNGFKVSTESFFEWGGFFYYGNQSFNVNPNSASIYLFSNLILTLYFIQGTLKYIFIGLIMILIISTISRGGFVCSVFVLLLYYFNASFSISFFKFKTLVYLVSIFLFIGLIYIGINLAIPGAIDFLFLRLQSGSSRDEYWTKGYKLITSSYRSIFFGNGPSILSIKLERSVHNSYIEAIGSGGLIYFVSLIVSIISWIRKHYRYSGFSVMVVILPVFLYANFETLLFNGLTILWFLLFLMSQYIRTLQVKSNTDNILYE